MPKGGKMDGVFWHCHFTPSILALPPGYEVGQMPEGLLCNHLFKAIFKALKFILPSICPLKKEPALTDSFLYYIIIIQIQFLALLYYIISIYFLYQLY